MVKFVDDSVHVNAVNMKDLHTYQVAGQFPYRVTTSKWTEDMLNHVTASARERRMVVNSQKTGLLCISEANSYEAKVKIEAEDGTVIESADMMKVLGFTFDSKGGVDAHIKNIMNKFRSRTWALRNLKRKGMSEEGLLRVYVTTIRPL